MIKIDGEKIKKLRESQGLTQLYMATAVEVTTDTISRWENKRYPTIKVENGDKLAEALGVTLEEILLEEVEEEHETTTEAPSDIAPHTQQKRRPYLLLWTAVLLFLSLFLGVVYFFALNPVTHIEAVRIMPSRAIPNSPFPIVVEIRHSSSSSVSLILKETLPSGCTIVEKSPKIGFSSSGNELKWLKKVSGTTRFSYLVKINGTTGKSHAFSGTVSTSNGTDSVIVTGNNSIELDQFHWADNDGNNEISDQEILTVFDYYSGIDDFTIDIEFIEKMWLGSRYSWDRETNLITISP